MVNGKAVVKEGGQEENRKEKCIEEESIGPAGKVAQNDAVNGS